MANVMNIEVDVGSLSLSLPLSSCLLKDAVDNCIKQHRERRIRQDTRFPSII